MAAKKSESTKKVPKTAAPAEAPSPLPPVEALLPPAALERLRAGFDEAAMLYGADMAVKYPYPPAGPWTDPPGDMFYRTKPLLPHKKREMVLLATLTGQRAYSELAVHVYWGLMEGLDPDEIANVLLLTSMYTGMPTWSNAIRVLRTALTTLAKIAAEAETDPTRAQTANLMPVYMAGMRG